MLQVAATNSPAGRGIGLLLYLLLLLRLLLFCDEMVLVITPAEEELITKEVAGVMLDIVNDNQVALMRRF